MTRRTACLLTMAAALLVAGCGGDEPSATPSESSAPPSSAAPPSTPASSSAPPSSTESAFDGTVIEVAVRDGKVRPPTRRVEVPEGGAVRLLVTSDVADELHVHGFDIEQELPAGEQVTLDFTADQTGLFEVETHETGLQLVQLEVR